MRGIICGALMALTITAANAAEDPLSTDYVLKYCKAIPKNMDPVTGHEIGWCLGIIVGVSSAVSGLHIAQEAGTGVQLDGWCIDVPDGTTPKALLDAVIKYTDAHPELRRKPFPSVVHLALREALPCKKVR